MVLHASDMKPHFHSKGWKHSSSTIKDEIPSDLFTTWTQQIWGWYSLVSWAPVLKDLLNWGIKSPFTITDCCIQRASTAPFLSTINGNTACPQNKQTNTHTFQMAPCISLHLDHLTWCQLRQQPPIIQFAKSKGPCAVVTFTAVNAKFTPDFKEGAEIVCSVSHCTVLLKKKMYVPL
jgi:hypothetical protein